MCGSGGMWRKRRKRRNLRGRSAGGAALLPAGGVEGVPEGTFPQHGPHQDLNTIEGRMIKFKKNTAAADGQIK